MGRKAGLLGKFFIIVGVLLLYLILVARLARSETAINIVNVTMNISSSSVVLNISNSIYEFNNTPSVIVIQQNFSVGFQLNSSNATIISNITCNNNSVSLACSCPSCPSVGSINCSFPNEVALDNATKSEFYNHYITSIGGKIEESSNKVAQDVLFKLEPTKAQLDSCREAQYNSSLKEQDSYRQRDKFAADNIALGTSLESEKQDKRMIQIIFFSYFLVSLLVLLALYGFWGRMKEYMRGWQ